jgi:regulator of sigma E protease
MTLWAIVLYEIAFLAHAFSHSLAARLAGMPVSAFDLGFGPRILTLTRKSTRYTVNLIPVGVSTVIDYASGPSGEKTSRFKSLLVVAAGPLGNFVLAAALFSIFAMVTGTAKSLTTQINTVVPKSPAAQAGLHSDDRILTIDGVPMKDGETVLRTIRTSGGHKLSILVEQDGVKRLFHVTPQYDARQRTWLIGFSPVVVRSHSDVSRAVGWGIATTVSAIGSYVGLAVSVLGLREPQAVISGRSAMESLLAFGPLLGPLANMSILSVMIGILNLIPIPPLDGGRALILLVDGLRRTADSP